MRIVELEKLARDQLAITAAYRASLMLMDKGWTRFPAASWDRPAIVAFEDAACIGGIVWAEDDDDMSIVVRFAWCEKSSPRAFAALLSRFRSKFKGRTVEFTYHEGNEPMAKAARVLRAETLSHTCRVRLPNMEVTGG